MPERTSLSPSDELIFQLWARQNGIKDVDNPDSHYDYRGYFKSVQGQPHEANSHFPDTYKTHSHPTFSIESQYSKGPFDGGMWNGENYLPQMQPVASHSPIQQLMGRR